MVMQSRQDVSQSIKKSPGKSLALPSIRLLLKAMAFRSWEELSDDDRSLCIGGEVPTLNFNGMKVWKPEHCLKERWEKEIESKVQRILSEAGHSWTSAPALFMLSREGRSEARPFVVYFHRSERKARKALRDLEDHGDMQPFGFSYLPRGGMLILTGDEVEGSATDLQLLLQDTEHNGKQIIACKEPVRDNITKGKRATIGGILKFGDDKYYGLTTAHIFFNDFDQLDRIRSNTSESMSSSSSSDSSGNLEADTVIPQVPERHHIFSVEGNERDLPLSAVTSGRGASGGRSLTVKDQDHHIGTAFDSDDLRLHGLERFYNPNQDWALFRIEDPRLQRSNEIRMASKEPIYPIPGYNSISPPSGELLVTSGPHGLLQATGIGMRSSITLPWSRGYVEAWPIACNLDTGSCGSWVIDRGTEVICGIVIAGCPGTGLSWMLPADPIFSNLLGQWTGSYSSIQEVFQVPSYNYIDLAVTQPSRATMSAKAQGRVSFVGLSQPMEPEFNWASASEIVLRRGRETQEHRHISGSRGIAEGTRSQGTVPQRLKPPKPSSVTTASSYPGRASGGSTADTQSELASTRQTSDLGSESKDQRKPGNASNLGDHLNGVAYDFVVKCQDAFEECLKFIRANPEILSVPADTLIEAAKAVISQDYFPARMCLRRAVILEQISEDIGVVPEMHFGIAEVVPIIENYFDLLIREDKAASGRFYNRFNELLESIYV